MTTTIHLPEFPSHPTCKRCDLYAAAKNPGVPTRFFEQSDPGSRLAPLVVVGMNPGVKEDATNRCFTGPSGNLLTNVYLNHADILSHPIYLTNAARCPTLGNNEKPKQRHYNACWSYTDDDLKTVASRHTDHIVYLLCLGADAYSSISKHLLGKAMALRHGFNNQGQTNVLGFVDRFRIFATFHPAAVLREQKYLYPVSDHIELLSNALNGRLPTPSSPHLVDPTWPTPPTKKSKQPSSKTFWTK